MGTTIQSVGKFQVLETLGTGANSTILHIRRSADSKHYALKVVPIATREDHKFVDQAEHERKHNSGGPKSDAQCEGDNCHKGESAILH